MKNHGEAFKIMQYTCKGCGFLEYLWNSRDGVTPFIIGSSCCPDHMAEHTDWQRDLPSPTLPLRASRVFVSPTKDEAKTRAISIHERHKASGMFEQYPHLKEIGDEELIKDKTNEIYRDGCGVIIISRREYIDRESSQECTSPGNN